MIRSNARRESRISAATSSSGSPTAQAGCEMVAGPFQFGACRSVTASPSGSSASALFMIADRNSGRPSPVSAETDSSFQSSHRGLRSDLLRTRIESGRGHSSSPSQMTMSACWMAASRGARLLLHGVVGVTKAGAVDQPHRKPVKVDMGFDQSRVVPGWADTIGDPRGRPAHSAGSTSPHWEVRR